MKESNKFCLPSGKSDENKLAKSPDNAILNQMDDEIDVEKDVPLIGRIQLRQVWRTAADKSDRVAIDHRIIKYKLQE